MTATTSPKRSNKPIFWSLFGGGGMLSALIGPALVLITGLIVPLGLLGPDAMGYAQVHALLQTLLGKLAIVVVIALFLFHGMHRLYHTLHDVGVHITPGIKALCHGLAAVGTLVAIVLVVSIR
jgi:fumarate reductase subunit D